MRHRRGTALSFGEWLGKAVMLCVCLALAAKPVAAFAMMHGACVPAQSQPVSAASHDASETPGAHHDAPAKHAHGPGGTTGNDPAGKPHAAVTTCCGMLCAMALLPPHCGTPAPLALFSSVLPELEQGRADGWVKRLFRPPRVA
jgi:hypothetical protein